MEEGRDAQGFRPGDIVALNNLGVAYASMKRHGEAIAVLERATRFKPSLANIYYNLGTEYALVGRYTKAIEAYKDALRLNPHYGAAYNNLGTAYFDLGRFREATEAYQQAVNSIAYNNLGVVYGRLRRYERAAASLARAVNLQPEMAKAHFNLGMMHFAMKDKVAALQQYRILTTLNPEMARDLYSEIYSDKVLDLKLFAEKARNKD